MFLNLDIFNCFLITEGNLFNILLLLFTSDCDKFIFKIDPPFFLFKAFEIPCDFNVEDVVIPNADKSFFSKFN